MLHKTRGIVFKKVKYSDSSGIVKIYTELFGLQSFIVSGIHSKKSSTKVNLLQPLSLVELIAYHKENNKLQRIKEIKSDISYSNIFTDISKSSIVFFINEVLQKSIKEEEPNPFLFEFIHTSLQVLDIKEGSCANFHISFLMHLCKYLGIFPGGNFSKTAPYFSLKEGTFQPAEPLHPFYLKGAEAEAFSLFTTTEISNCDSIAINAPQRKKIIEALLLYYHLHLENMQDIVSYKVLEEIFS